MIKCRRCIYYRPSLEFRHQGYCSIHRCEESLQKERELKERELNENGISEEKEYS